MIRHQQFKKGFARGQNFGGASLHFHPGFDGTYAGGTENACSGVDHTQAAYAHGSFILQMAQRGDWNAGYSRRIENTRTSWNGHGSTIDADVDESGRRGHASHYLFDSPVIAVAWATCLMAVYLHVVFR